MNTIGHPIPVIGFAAYSGTGKTTLLKELLRMLKARGLRVGVIKHAHHSFDTDIPGKDSYELRHAGATQMLIASSQRWALVTERLDNKVPRLASLLDQLSLDSLDLILVEGFKAEKFPKIELHRASTGNPLLCLKDPTIIAVATDAPLPIGPGIPVLDLNRPGEILQFITNRIEAGRAEVQSRVPATTALTS